MSVASAAFFSSSSIRHGPVLDPGGECLSASRPLGRSDARVVEGRD